MNRKFKGVLALFKTISALIILSAGVLFCAPQAAESAAQEVDGATAAILEAISDGADKVITAVPGKSKEKALVRAYEKKENVWTLRFTAEGYFGKNGVKADKKEGDKATPSGIYTFERAFGVAEDPGSILPYTKVGKNDVWVDDPKSKHYNKWADSSSPEKDWDSAEQLIKYAKAYKYAAALNYNNNPVIPGNGSAIFLHCSTGNATAGCISVPETAMVLFLGFIRDDTKIAISDDGEF